ncbi:MAG: hypothetical protein MR874_12090 [Coriobacteriaceae bacterium]|nr:hypothetical protein [Coriobacteriaceae bacterium]MCI6845476.1 hypothetical protein [Coriobacteriaceae bacterium]
MPLSRLAGPSAIPERLSAMHYDTPLPTDAERTRRDIAEFLRSGWSCAEVVGTIPPTPTRADVDRVGHMYRHYAPQSVVVVQRAGRVFLIRRSAVAGNLELGLSVIDAP